MRDKNFLINNGVNVEGSLELFGDMEMYDETLEEFLSSVDSKISDLKKYKEMSDTYNYAIVAHSLKSDCKFLGFTHLAELSLMHEQAGKANDITTIYNNYDSLIEETNKVIDIASKYLGKVSNKIEVKEETTASKYILVVDDSDIITNYVKKMFTGELGVKIATDGNAAINTINEDTEGKIIGMLLDLNLPGVNGFDVLEYFKQNNLFQKIPVTVITGSDSTDDIQKVFTYPVIDVLGKPFNEMNLKATIDKMFNL